MIMHHQLERSLSIAAPGSGPCASLPSDPMTPRAAGFKILAAQQRGTVTHSHSSAIPNTVILPARWLRHSTTGHGLDGVA